MVTKKKTNPVTRFEKSHALFIRKHLRYGDIKIIVVTVGCSRELVKMVLNGSRPFRKGKSRKVMEVAEDIIRKRQLSQSINIL